jgi:hypothetical protein
MSKSYRKPYSPVTGATSAARDKRTASRCYRRLQEHSLRSFQGDWEDYLIPERYEATHNDVWSWGRDGKQSLQERRGQYNNPFAYVCSPTWMTHEEIMNRWEESKRRDDEWLVYLIRK